MLKKNIIELPIGKFALKAVSLFILWYGFYELWLLPNGRLDHWVALRVIDGSALMVNVLGFEVWIQERVVGIVGNSGILMVDGCTGISAIGLFLGFIWSFPGQNKSRLLFSIFGIAVIYIVNILRISMLILMQELAPQFFDFTHDYSTTVIFYVIIFFLWMLWVRISEGLESLAPVDTAQGSL